MISAVDLLKGLGILRGMEVIEVPGATGWIDTDYSGKARAALVPLPPDLSSSTWKRRTRRATAASQGKDPGHRGFRPGNH